MSSSRRKSLLTFAVVFLVVLAIDLALSRFGLDQPLWWWAVMGVLAGMVLGWIQWRRAQ